MLNTANNRISGRQVKRLHTVKNALKLPDEKYRQVLSHNFGVNTSKALTFSQAENLLKALEEEAVKKDVWKTIKGKSNYEYLGNRPGMASPAQLRKIEASWKDASRLGNTSKRKKAVRTFLNNHFKVSDLRWLKEEKVRKIIKALEQMKKQKILKSKGPF